MQKWWLTDTPVESMALWDRGTFRRGSEYALDDKVVRVDVPERGDTVLGAVHGSRGELYTVRCTWSTKHQMVVCSCTCPVGTMCKHAVAVLIVAQARAELGPVSAPGSGDWRSVLAPAVSPPPKYAQPDVFGYGMLIQWEESGRGWVLQPLKRTKTGKWSRSVEWMTVYRSSVPQYQEHVAMWQAMKQFLHLNGSLQASAWWSSGGPSLTDMTSEQCAFLWRLAGMGVFLGLDVDGSTVPVGLSHKNMEVALDATSTADGGVQVQPVLQCAQRRVLAGVEAVVFGAQAQLALVLPELKEEGAAAPPVLWRLPDGVPTSVASIMQLDDPVIVPPLDRDAFLGQLAPALATRVPVGSSDGSVQVPTLSAPQLVVTVDHHEGLWASVELGFQYDLDGVAHRLSIDPSATSMPRDHEAEVALIGRLQPLPVLQGQELDGERYRDVVMRVGPEFSARDQVVWEDVGTVPSFREVGDDLRIDVSMDTPNQQQDWFDLSFAVVVGEHTIPADQFIVAVASGDPYVTLPSGDYVDLRRPELQRLRELILEAQAHIPDRSDKLSVNAYHADWWEELMELGPLAAQSEAYFHNVKALAEAPDRERAELPSSVDVVLRPYQQEGFQWLCALWDAQLGGILADDMGLGKTVQVLAAIARGVERQAADPEEERAPVLVVAPTSVVHNWQREASRFCPSLKVEVIGATLAKAKVDLVGLASTVDVVVTSYTRLRLDAEQYQGIDWSAVVCDEAHSLKNYRTKAFRAVVELKTPRRVLLSGTPLENSLMDLWALMKLAAPGLLPRRAEFSQHYQRPIENGDVPERLQLLKRRMRPFMLRRTKELVASELPEKSISVVTVDLDAKHQRLYDRALARERQNILGLLKDDDGKKRVDVLAGLTRLRRLSLDVSITREKFQGKPPPAAKLEVLTESLGELAAQGHRALVFSQFTDFLDKIGERLDGAGLAYCRLDGATTRRDRVVEEFRSGSAPVFLISLKAGGVGLTLTEADYVFITDPWWNPAAENQAIDRAHRIGQDKPVTVYRLISAGTIEEKVFALQQRKQSLFDDVVDDGTFTAAALTNEDIAALLDS